MSTSDLKKVVVITINYNNSSETIICINSILDADYRNFHIIVVDNGSNITDFKNIKDHIAKIDDTRISQYRIEKNRNYVGGINFGFSKAYEYNPDYYLIMNNDSIIDNKSISELITTSERFDDKCIVTGKVYDYSEKNILQTVGSRLINSRYLIFENIGLNERDNGQYDSYQKRDMIDDVFLLLPRQCFKDVGRYCEYFYFNGESTDYILRAIKAGYEPVFTPKAKLWHKGSGSVGGRKSNPYISYWNARSKLTLRYLHIKPKDFRRFFILNLLKEIKWLLLSLIQILSSSKQKELKGRIAALKGIWDFFFISRRRIRHDISKS